MSRVDVSRHCRSQRPDLEVGKWKCALGPFPGAAYYSVACLCKVMIPTMFSRLAGLLAMRHRTPSSKRSANISRSPASRVGASACDNEGTKTARKNPARLLANAATSPSR